MAPTQTPTHCPHCGLNLTELVPSSGSTPELCPSCGKRLTTPPTPWEVATAPVTRYFRDLYEIIVRPTEFFRRLPPEGGVAGPLVFALVTHWIGSALAWIWNTLIGGAIFTYFNGMWKMAGDVADIDSPGRSALITQARDRFVSWIWGAGSVIADPFFTVVAILFTSFFVFLGARLFVTPGKSGHPREIRYESALRIVCYGMGPAIFAVIPLFGGLLAHLWTAVVTIIAAREVYRIGTGRATVVALFPNLLFLGIILLGLLFFAAVALKFFLSAAT